MKLAALVCGADVDPAPVLEGIVRALQQRGVQPGGAIQHNPGPCTMELEILPSGLRMPISQKRGSDAAGCRLDASALAEAASLVRRAIQDGPPLAVFNKFGEQEARGDGMRDEMASAAMAGVPVLTAVREPLLAQWLEFTGGDSAQLACSVDAALAWWDALAAG